MDDALRKFEKRHRAVTKKHRQLAQGYVTKLGRNGLIQHHPRRNLPGASPRSIVMIALGFFAFKGLLLHSMGEVEYLARIATLTQGSLVEKAGAFMMQIDPVTRWGLEQLTPFLS
ncbi:hypothetical protein [Puniceibacterium sp. IMCC21224]|uniref:hypothetical protein n=1 Tax=Puniceibacterium sp. IMCC21224 TaxID=1618204 RepID=UPI00064DF67E|nr:hypothetical protein [Puniceibacterium sp. IMCC21224]KMK68141.1 hypothetical protein IMCC21224_113021 [Puniceibacterium sp. IMCC21224]